MTTDKIPHPIIATQKEWLALRLEHLQHEKEITKLRDRVVSERRMLPMVRVEKEYTFEGPEGKRSLLDLFEGRRQLIIYHFMFDPEWDKGCSGCTGFVDALGDLSLLQERDTSFSIISRAPLPKLEKYRMERGWNRTWYSSFESDFNYDYHATLDASVAPIEYNYKTEAELMKRRGAEHLVGEEHGLSVFFAMKGDVFHTYSCYARGTEGITDSYSLLDLTPYGRQEDWEDSPIGWPQRPTYG